MKKMLGIIAIVAIIGLGFAACDIGDDGGTIESDFCKNDTCYAIGETGPAGGIIVFHRHNGFTVSGFSASDLLWHESWKHPEADEYFFFDSYTAYYLEAAPSNEPNAAWGRIRVYDNATTAWPTPDLTIGNGRKDTMAITNYLTDPQLYANAVERNGRTYAAEHCYQKEDGDFYDWFLPSIGELKAMFNAREHLNSTSFTYWSSTQKGDELDVWCIDFRNTMGPVCMSKLGTMRVRAMRYVTERDKP